MVPLINLLPGDVGRPVTDIASDLLYPDLTADAREVLRTLIPFEREVATRDRRRFQARVTPYRTIENRIDGVVIVFTEVTAFRALEQDLEDARAYAEAIVETVREPLLVLDGAMRVVSANRSFYRAFGVGPGEVEERELSSLGNGQWEIPELRRLLETVLPENTSFDDFRVEHDFPRVGRRVLLLNARRISGGKRGAHPPRLRGRDRHGAREHTMRPCRTEPEDTAPSGATNLRRQAEEAVAAQPARQHGSLSHDEALALVHELQVHQIELELQNEELDADAARGRGTAGPVRRPLRLRPGRLLHARRGGSD